MTGPNSLKARAKYGNWKGTVTYDAAVVYLPLPFRWDYEAAFPSFYFYSTYGRIWLTGTNTSLYRDVWGGYVRYYTGNRYSWASKITIYGTYRGMSGARGDIWSYTKGTLGAFWSSTAWKYTYAY